MQYSVNQQRGVPLNSAHEVFKAAVNGLRLPDRVGGGLSEAVSNLRFESREYVHLYKEIQAPGNHFDPVFQATLQQYEYEKDPAYLDELVRFWSGEPIRTPALRAQTKIVGRFSQKQPARRPEDLAIGRLGFVARMLVAAGYRGWVLFLDEAELIAKFSLSGRMRSFGVLSQLIGVRPTSPPGLATIGDYHAGPGGRVTLRGDPEKMSTWNFGSRPEAYHDTEVGFSVLRGSGFQMNIEPLSPERMALMHNKVRNLLATCYGTPADSEGFCGIRRRESSSSSKECDNAAGSKALKYGL